MDDRLMTLVWSGIFAATYGSVLAFLAFDYVLALFRRPEPWYAHPVRLPNQDDQVAWRGAVREVAVLSGEHLPQELPGGNTFTCSCGQPTYELECSWCEAYYQCYGRSAGKRALRRAGVITNSAACE